MSNNQLHIEQVWRQFIVVSWKATVERFNTIEEAENYITWWKPHEETEAYWPMLLEQQVAIAEWMQQLNENMESVIKSNENILSRMDMLEWLYRKQLRKKNG